MNNDNVNKIMCLMALKFCFFKAKTKLEIMSVKKSKIGLKCLSIGIM